MAHLKVEFHIIVLHAIQSFFILFVQVMVACFEVFQTWEDEYEKLQVLLRDIVKRKREENLKMVWRLSPAHRKLQSRLDHMRRFRRQHEQLRAVIVRVLRPQVRISFLCTLKSVHTNSQNLVFISFVVSSVVLSLTLWPGFCFVFFYNPSHPK